MREPVGRGIKMFYRGRMSMVSRIEETHETRSINKHLLFRVVRARRFASEVHVYAIIVG